MNEIVINIDNEDDYINKYNVNKTEIINNPSILLDGFNPLVFLSTNFL